MSWHAKQDTATGRWEVWGDQQDNRRIARCKQSGEHEAKLIAAAPELLEALEAMYEAFFHMADTKEGCEALCTASEALVKARGEK